MTTLLASSLPHCWVRRALRFVQKAGLVIVVSALPGCGGGGSPKPSPSPTLEPLGPTPVPLTPIANEQVTSDAPTFTVRNAQSFDQGQATYTFRVTTASGQHEIASGTVAAGSGRTSLMFAQALPRGMTLSWSVVAKSASSEVASGTATFRTIAVACQSSSSPYAKSVVDFFLTACTLAHNKYKDPQEVLGPPDAGGTAPDMYFGFMSLGDGGYVTVDTQSCAQDLPGADVRVFQSVSQEPVTLFASGSPTGPFQEIGSRVRCGTRLPGTFSRYCDFDLAAAEVQEARYFRIQDGELFPCPGDTVTEGADIDAIEILHLK